MAESESSVLSQILSVADRHPATKVAKLIYQYQDDNSRTTLVLLLEEVAQNPQFVTDFNIVLDYYMRHLINVIKSRDGAFNECGRILDALTRIWGRRVDEVYDRIVEQIQTLTLNCQDAEERAKEKENEANAETSEATPKVKRRKRPINPDPYDVKMEIKQFRVMDSEKLFALPLTLTNPNLTPNYFAEDHLNPALWRHSFVIDPDNPDNKDSKRNYKVFACHIEHRFNTPVNDYNFRWHFAIKDYIDELDKDVDMDFVADCTETGDVDMDSRERIQWRPQTYLQKAITLENQAFERHLSASARKRPPDNALGSHIEKLARLSLQASNTGMGQQANEKHKLYQTQDSGIGDSMLADSFAQDSFGGEMSSIDKDASMASMTSINNTSANQMCDDSGNGTLEMSLNGSTVPNESGNNSSLELTLPTFNQSSVLESTKLDDTENNGNSIDLGFADATVNAKVLPNVTITTEKLSQSDDEGIVLSDQEESYNNLTAPIENTNRLQPEEIFDIKYPLVKNVFNLPEKNLRRYVLFKLPLECNLIQMKQSDKPKTQKKPNESKKVPVKEQKTNLKKYQNMGMPDSFFKLFSNGEKEAESFDEDSDSDSSCIVNEIDFVGYSEEMHLIYGGKPPPVWPDGHEGVYPRNTLSLNEDEARGDETAMEVEVQEDQGKAIEAKKNTNEQNTTSNEAPTFTENAGDENISDDDDDDDFANDIQTETDLKIRDWHRTIAPSLAAAHARQHFSVYDIGSKIIEKLQNGAETFNDLIKDADPTDISKYFLSVLMLVNQKNVLLDRGEPNYDEPTDLMNLKVKLISTQRHQVAFEDDIGQHDTVVKPSTKTNKSAQSPSVVALKQHNVITKTVRTLQPIPKAVSDKDNDSGISSMASSMQSKDSHS